MEIWLTSLGFESINKKQAQHGCKGFIIHKQCKLFWLSDYFNQSWPTSFPKFMHPFSIQRFMQKSIPNASHSLTIKDHTTHRIVANDYLHNLPVKPTNIFSHAPNSCSLSSNYRILIQSIWSNHCNSLNSCNWSIQFHSQTHNFQIKQTTA